MTEDELEAAARAIQQAGTVGYNAARIYARRALKAAESARGYFSAGPILTQERAIRALEELDCMYVNGDRVPFAGIPADPESSVRRETIKECVAALRAVYAANHDGEAT